ncbi:hypothetical protein HPB50_011953 [Hyalomma asiaticum]|uniref:Uncharacterized protein n=1 Tax=Hyalomma asiaticum TaxID=266040 RepID=A0ACB7T5X7_HYAAI|nr:hypothetical protein HPB50_011953 [Hyalomma asiaticum]
MPWLKSELCSALEKSLPQQSDEEERSVSSASAEAASPSSDVRSVFATLAGSNTAPTGFDRLKKEVEENAEKAKSTANAGIRTAGEARNDVVLKFLDALISANIPLEKVDNPKLRTFLQTHVRNGGSVPGSDALRRRLPELFEKHEANLKAMFQGTTVSVITDETTDDRSKSVVNVLFVQSARSASTSLQPVLVEVKFVDEVKSSVIGRIVTRTLTRENWVAQAGQKLSARSSEKALARNNPMCLKHFTEGVVQSSAKRHCTEV